jgi:diguanylate cyclase (GGDEF)-like protein/PAS domain S-box-containing protein
VLTPGARRSHARIVLQTQGPAADTLAVGEGRSIAADGSRGWRGGSLDPGQALTVLLETHPDADVAAINGSGVAVPVPATVPLGRHRPLLIPTTLDLVVPADRVVLVDLYARARAAGCATAPVRRVEDPEQPVTVSAVDVRREHGVIVLVFADDLEDETASLVRAAQAPTPPRVARATKDASAVFTWVDDALPRILGWRPEELVGHRSLELVHPEDQELAIANWLNLLETPGTGRRVRLRHRHRDGRWVWLEITNHNHLDDPDPAASPPGAPPGQIVADMVDISDEMAAHQALEARERLLAQLAETVPLGLLHADQRGHLLFANDQLHQILAAPRTASLARLFDQVLPEDHPAIEQALADALGGSPKDLEVRVVAGSELRTCLVRLRPLHGAPAAEPSAFDGLVGCVEDVTLSVRLRRELEQQATYDPLTECRNRASTFAALEEALARSGRRPGGLAVLFVDLNGFKAVNDRLGHRAGDQLLCVAARRLQESVRAGDVVGRIGGDEFLVVAPGVRRAADGLALAEVLAARLAEPILLEGHRLTVTASIGVAWTADPATPGDGLVAAADTAMYRAKQRRSGPCLADWRALPAAPPPS